MCRLAVIAPIVWKIRIAHLISHLEKGDIARYEACSMKYRNIDIGKVTGLPPKFVEEILHELFVIELLVGLECRRALGALRSLNERITQESNNDLLRSLLCDEGANANDIGSIAMLPMLTRAKISEYV